jgi:hypothetical protein
MTSAFVLPDLSPGAQAFVRISYGVLLFATLVWALPQARRFFVSERWGGYAESAPAGDLLHRPSVYPVVVAVWMMCALLIASGRATVGAALLNAVLCRHYFIGMRWKGLLRGMGAPGFMSYWLGVAVLLLEATTRFAPPARPAALFALQVDLALIILSAGLYKVTAGFASNDGMELGLANPAWGYWWRWYKELRPSHWLFWTLNQLGWSTEVGAAILCLIPATRTLGGLLLIATFLFIATQIRLGFLCEMVMVCGVLYFAPGTTPDRVVTSIASVGGAAAGARALGWLSAPLTTALWLYVALLPLVHAGLYFNFYSRHRLPAPLQWLLERYTNVFGIIIWRVFTADLVNFVIRIHRQDRVTRSRTLLSHYGVTNGHRFGHVAESITICCVFTTLKYYATNTALFEQRLARYARTLPCDENHVLVFEYVNLAKTPHRFDFVPVAEFTVDPVARSVQRTALRPEFSVHAAHAHSPLHEGVTPGTYVPRGLPTR